MKKPLALTFCLFSGCLLLAGCTDADWDRAMNYGGAAEQDEAPARPPRPVAVAAPATVAAAPAAPSNADFCRSVATQDATGNGFDQATQQRVFAQSYSQCVAIYTR
jgi:hypothetical protein